MKMIRRHMCDKPATDWRFRPPASESPGNRRKTAEFVAFFPLITGDSSRRFTVDTAASTEIAAGGELQPGRERAGTLQASEWLEGEQGERRWAAGMLRRAARCGRWEVE